MAFYQAEGLKVQQSMTEKETGEREFLMVYGESEQWHVRKTIVEIVTCVVKLWGWYDANVKPLLAVRKLVRAV